jgi:hypothetical protein
LKCTYEIAEILELTLIGGLPQYYITDCF